MVSVTLTWRSMHDDRVCNVCRNLEGFKWMFTVGASEFPDYLSHPMYGLVWNTTVGSNAHGHKGNCRCHLETVWEWGDLLQRLRVIRERLEMAVAEGESKAETFNP